MQLRALLIALPLIGCGKKAEDKPKAGSGSATAKPVADEGTMPAEVTAWMPKGAQAAWEASAWNSRLTLRTSGTMSMAGDPAAIQIKADKAKVFDGKTEHELGFAIDTPCSAAFKKQIDGGTQTITKQFVLGADGKLIAGEGRVGMRKGKAAVVCGGMDGIYTLDDAGKCTQHQQHFKKWESKPATCAWSSENGKDVLEVGDATVIADGDTLQSDQFAQFVKEGYHQAAASYDEAKAAVTAKVKADDPLEVAKAAGGKVGETNTVASLHATYANDTAALKGKPVEVTAQYLNSNTMSSGGKSTYSAILVDDKDHTKLTLTCTTAEEVKGLKQYAKVVAKGSVSESFDRPSLDGCTLTAAK